MIDFPAATFLLIFEKNEQKMTAGKLIVGMLCNKLQWRPPQYLFVTILFVLFFLQVRLNLQFD